MLLEDGQHIDAWPFASITRSTECMMCGLKGEAGDWIYDTVSDACSNYGTW